ncbi:MULTISPECIES: hypothetical protein [Pseudomonas]|uniref:hypothetical protein n=1 Tax=Pseudomonas TaxID=286 RepID=UPI000A1D898E|nr:MULTISPECIES: hypothetical protein [Pseudomonas]MCX4221068.1 hypothetical protein [Pseudomonas sp. MCal1]UIN52523.1 hypothetical protein LXN51_16080 [Pseudomonas kribbensis]
MTVKSGVTVGLALCGALIAGQVLAECVPAPVTGARDFSVCRAWPAYPGLTLNAVSKFAPDPVYGKDNDVGSYDLGLSVTTDEFKTIATYHLPSAFMSDAIALESVEFDTARYKLTPELRAFGVRVRFKGSSRVNPMDQVLLSLYVKEGDKLRPVLDRLVMYDYGGEWDGGCAGERYYTDRTIEIGKTSSHGYADLIVKSVTTGLVGEGPPDTCALKTTADKPVLTTLRYDGKSYVLPKGFKAIE